MTTSSDTPKTRRSRPQWPQLMLLWTVLGVSSLTAGLSWWRSGLNPLSAALSGVVVFNLVTLITSRRRQRLLLTIAPYLYIALLLAGWLYAFYIIYPSRLSQQLILTISLSLPALYAQFFNRFTGPQALLQAGGTLSAFLLLNLPHALLTLSGSQLLDGPFFALLFAVSQALLLGFIASAAWLEGELTQVKQDAAWFQRLAHHDALTGLPNRRQIETALATSLAQSNRSGIPCAVLMIDIDHFKRFNDKFGHPVGDEVLQHIAHRLRSQLRTGNTLGRWGGEEFMVVAPQTEIHEAQQLGERLRHAVRSEPAAGEHMLTISIGMTAYRPGDTPETIVARADRALYRAKQGGRDRLEV
jgi:diguanylate cyclase (GGDEF)-like protein